MSAAIEQFHQKGYARTSLADVATAAGISPGNVFYYFKAKEELALAVVEEWCTLLSGYLADLEAKDDPWRRLLGFVKQAGLMRDIYVELGCPLAGLTRDLRQQSESLSVHVARVYDTQYQWVLKEFARGGASHRDAKRLTRTLMASFHGAIHLAYTQSDKSIITDEVERLTKWLQDQRAIVEQIA